MKIRVRSALVVLAVTAVTGIAAALPAAAVSGGGCLTYTNGTVCTNNDPTGYQASYHKTAGADVVADFHLVASDGSWYGDLGKFPVSIGDTKTYVFSVGNQGCRRTQLMDLTHGTSLYGPYLCK